MKEIKEPIEYKEFLYIFDPNGQEILSYDIVGKVVEINSTQMKMMFEV